MDLELTAQSITDTITARLRDEFPAWSVQMVFGDNRKYSDTVSTWWTATTKSRKVHGTICVKWTRRMRGNKPQMVVAVRWGISPGTFVTRENKADFITVSMEMTNNAPKVEQLIRAEATSMGDPLEILTKKANKSRMRL